MNFTLVKIDVSPYLKLGHQPVIMTERVGTHMVPENFIGRDPENWWTCRTGDKVRVPMYALRTADSSAAALFAAGMEIGIRLASDLQKKRPSLTVKNIHLLLGSQVDDLRPEHDCFRVYLGVSVEVVE